jgi:hypothetical protein
MRVPAAGRRLPQLRTFPASVLEKLLSMDIAKSEYEEFFLPNPEPEQLHAYLN